MADVVIRINVTPEPRKMFDLSANKVIDGVVSGYFARFYTENPPPVATELVAGKLWIAFTPDFNEVKQKAADSAAEVNQ